MTEANARPTDGAGAPERDESWCAEEQIHDLVALMKDWSRRYPDRVWLFEPWPGPAGRPDGDNGAWTWAQAAAEALALASWIEETLPARGRNISILSRNRAHWILADLAIMASGNVTVPIFTTQSADITRYIVEFSEIDILFVGEAENWQKVRDVIPDHVTIVRLPQTPDVDADHDWSDLLQKYHGRQPAYAGRSDDVVTIVYTSGTTGVPKGVMHTHHSLIAPMLRSTEPLEIERFPRFLSYLPLSHLAEREQIFAMSLVQCGSISFMEKRTTLLRDMRQARPTFFFGAPRVWEQFQQEILASFGGRAAFEAAYAADAATTAQTARAFLGFEDVKVLLSGSAPISRSLLEFYESLGFTLLEGFGQTEAMGLMCTRRDVMRLGSIGKPVDGIEARLSHEGELLVKGDGFSPGYFKDPEKTAETFVDGWVHTGDRARVDEDGFYYITGRIRDYFKTIHGKYVAPLPMEDAFAKQAEVDQRCLLGRGYSKTVMICTLSQAGRNAAPEDLSQRLSQRAEAINAGVEKHARIGAVIVADEEWAIDNGFLTTTLKLKRDRVETVYGELAEKLALQSAEQKRILVALRP
ncbi:AMP-binding protein [Rhizobium sp. DKSPLA3]|uniref:AMP-binding protein n=1 Tax=Rhizobium quercicola TaxID=2901226 RepID=A0A9X1NQC9_9HYPH|nr:AMP-binding protein [Rhizobium quercicola]MCD7107794.1 AMP-binding protein [Rhizobium quercicola]